MLTIVVKFYGDTTNLQKPALVECQADGEDEVAEDEQAGV